MKEARTERLVIMVTPEEKAKIEKKAKDEYLTASTYGRMKILK